MKKTYLDNPLIAIYKRTSNNYLSSGKLLIKLFIGSIVLGITSSTIDSPVMAYLQLVLFCSITFVMGFVGLKFRYRSDEDIDVVVQYMPVLSANKVYRIIESSISYVASIIFSLYFYIWFASGIGLIIVFPVISLTQS